MTKARIIKHIARDGTVTWRVRLDLRTEDGKRWQPQYTYASEEEAEWALLHGPEQTQPRLEDLTLGPTVPSARALYRARHGRVVYFVLAPTLGAIKIGVSNDVPGRLRYLQGACPDRLRLVAVRRDGPRPHRERDLHGRFAPLLIAGEWFRAQEPLLAYIAAHAEVPAAYYERAMGFVAPDFRSAFPWLFEE